MFGDHAAYIIPSYAITFAVIGGLVVFVVIQYRRRLAEIARLEAQGVKRRGDRS